jgi:hypothetical protein
MSGRLPVIPSGRNWSTHHSRELRVQLTLPVYERPTSAWDRPSRIRCRIGDMFILED